MTEENRAARRAFASTCSRASRTSPSRVPRSIASAVCAASVFRRPISGEENGSWPVARTTVSAPNDPDVVTSGIEIASPSTAPCSCASACPTPTGVVMSQLTRPKKPRSDSASSPSERSIAPLAMNRSAVRLRKSASVARRSARDRSSRTLLTRAPTMSPERRNAMRATRSDACRTASVWCGSVKKKLSPRNDRKDATIPLPRPAIAPAATTARRQTAVAAARFLEPRASAIPTAAADAQIPTARMTVIEADRDARTFLIFRSLAHPSDGPDASSETS